MTFGFRLFFIIIYTIIVIGAIINHVVFSPKHAQKRRHCINYNNSVGI